MPPDERQDGRHADIRGTAREQLLDAAARIFAERGYRGASVASIAAAAGVTKGALYWSFKSKADLFFSLLDERVDRRVRLLVQAVETIAGEDAVTPLVSQEISAVIDEQRQILLLAHEYWSLAARDPELGARYAEWQRSLRELIAHALVAHHEATSVVLTADPEELATAIIALSIGLSMTRMIDPESVPDQLLGDVLEVLYDGLVLRSASAALRPTNKQYEASARRVIK
jgi:AcrR family transcriptional regulator